METVARRPLLEAQVQRVSAELAEKRMGGDELRRGLARLKEAHESHYEESLAFLRSQHRALEVEQLQIEKKSQEAVAKKKEYCESFNPFKRWTCFQMREKQERIIEDLQGVLAGVRRHQGAVRASIQGGAARLKLLKESVGSEADKLLFSEVAEAMQMHTRLLENQGEGKLLKESLAEKEAELRRAREVEASPTARLLKEWNRVSTDLLLIVLLVLAAPYLQRALAYYLFMPWVARARPLRLAGREAPEREFIVPRREPLSVGAAAPTLKVKLRPGEPLFLRAAFARPLQNTEDCEVRTQLLFRWSAPFISYAAGLTLLTRIALKAESAGHAQVTVAAPDDPDLNLMQIDLREHPGIVVHPRLLVGVQGDIHLKTTWRLFSLHAWSSGQLRYILLSGTGSIFLSGLGDLVAEKLEADSARIEQAHIAAFDTRLDVSTRRTESFLPYLLGMTPLVDAQYVGSGSYFWQKSVGEQRRSLAERSLDALFGAVGKLLGF